MTFQSTVTERGQVVIPKKVRDALGILKHQKIVFELSGNEKAVVLRPVADILDIAGSLVPAQKVSAVKTRDSFEKSYERR